MSHMHFIQLNLTFVRYSCVLVSLVELEASEDMVCKGCREAERGVVIERMYVVL
jgi:hypothetical protein